MVPCHFDCAKLVKHFNRTRCFCTFDENFLCHISLLAYYQQNKSSKTHHEPCNRCRKYPFKLAVFENGDIIEQWKGETVDRDAIITLYKKYPIDATIVSDVSGITKICQKI
jgi:hypothetical protein